MKAFLNFLFTSLGLVLIVVTLVFVLAGTLLAPRAKQGIEQALGYVFHTDVHIASLSLSPMREMLEVRGLTIENPSPYKAGPAMRFDSIAIRVNPRTLLSGTIIIEEVRIRGVRIVLCHELGEGSNLSRLMREPSQAEGKNAAPGKESPQTVKRRGIIIRKMVVDGGTLTLRSSLLPDATATLPIAPFTLTNVNKSEPVTLAEMSVVIVRGLLDKALSVKGLLEPAGNLLRSILDGFPR